LNWAGLHAPYSIQTLIYPDAETPPETPVGHSFVPGGHADNKFAPMAPVAPVAPVAPAGASAGEQDASAPATPLAGGVTTAAANNAVVAKIFGDAALAVTAVTE